MPANPKHLTKNPWQRLAKISAGIVGGYFITALLHMMMALLLPNHLEVLITSVITYFVVWSFFLLLPFTFKNGWKVWLFYILGIAILYGLFILIQPSNPFIHG
ncbi:MAG: hypothetical protein ACR2MS_05325 [Weeksellaceae bacterium]